MRDLLAIHHRLQRLTYIFSGIGIATYLIMNYLKSRIFAYVFIIDLIFLLFITYSDMKIEYEIKKEVQS